MSRFLLLITSIFLWVVCHAQNPNTGVEVAKMKFMEKQVVPPSPDAAELGKYGNTQVSLFTGTPNISVPLMELKGTGLSLPVSLSYNASGYKPEDAASWVGSSWSFQAGGVITRAAIGNPDKDTTYFGAGDSLLIPPNPLDVIPSYTYMHYVQDGTKETRPDIYYYNFAGHSGKFILRPDQTVAKKEKDLKKIIPCITGNCYESNFIIVDEQGITYTFSQTETTTMLPYDGVGDPSGNTYIFVSAWYLTSISSADGNETVEFEYYSTTNPQTVYQNMIPNRSVSFTYGVQRYNETCITPHVVSDLSSAENPPPTVSIKRKFLKKITLKKLNTVVAYIDIVSALSQRLDSDFDEDRRLNEVKLYSTVNDSSRLIKKYSFYYSYFGDTAATGPLAFLQKRLRLDSLQEISNNSNTVSPPPYVFTYNTDWSPRFTASLDHWGFYNASANTSMVPNVLFAGGLIEGHFFSAQNIGDGANREPSLNGSAATILTKIKYPTGGYTTFEYELNRAKFEDNSIYDVGGIRVKEIVDYSFANKTATAKRYSYLLDDGITSGRAGIRPVYNTNSSYHHYHTLGSACTAMTHDECCEVNYSYGDYTLYTISVSTNSVFGLGSFQGSPFGYSQVAESQVDLSTNQPLGKTVYKYDIGQYFEYEEDIKSGNLIQQSVYDNTGKLLQETTSTYEYQTEPDIQAQIVKSQELQTNKTYYCKLGTNSYYNYGSWQSPDSSCTVSAEYATKLYITNYTIYPQNKRLTSQVQKTYDQLSGRYVYTSKKYGYNSTHNYPVTIEDTTSNGEKIVTTIKYAIDYDTTTTSSTFAKDIKYLQQQNLPGLPIEKLQYRLYPDNSRKYLNGQLIDYDLSNPTNIYFLEANPPLTSVTPSTISSGNLTFDSHYRLAGKFAYTLGNIERQSKTNDAVKSYLWDYNSQYPIAETVNFYLGDTVITGPRGSILLLRLPLIFYTSFETSYKGNLTFSGTPQYDSTSPTGRRCYSLGGGSISANLDASRDYIVSYWRNNTSGFSVTGSTGYKKGMAHNGWTYFEHSVSGAGSTTISGSGLIDEVRIYPKTSIMTTSTYDPLIGATSACDPNNHITYYEYDGLNRLINVKDDDRNIIKNFKYNYGADTALTASSATFFYNQARSGTYIKNNCSAGTPDTVLYTVPYGKYASTVNQTDANNKAEADVNANGQAYANANGGCWFYNVTKVSGWIQKDDCPYVKGPGYIAKDTIPANKFKSAISQTAADSLAINDYLTNGQAHINAHFGCTCDAENLRYINDSCETGTKIYVGGESIGGGQYKCYYIYQFSNWTSGLYYEISNSECLIED